ncbi:PPOX class F420-dependent oxidoreductase [Mycolicibacterium sphagni]|uniref:PPOX class F420-dependent oxidoreductase n=1 Tax=Mycolicibacterium sphagni TaxID=1786 RepID=UPI0021F37943|nr:PPOX class F420-dependent oxidoreductase [Mycolicibacterium sphagni]MCV7174475.1 PPOX class F420-dependent oxidoreductase [Mycolicibacterium sphagni]
MAPTFHDVAQSKYLQLITFTKDGTPKPTAIWGVPDGDRLLVITDRASWKVKRIRNTPRVTIAESNALGKPKGAAVEATARVLPDSQTRDVYNKVLRRYWQHAAWFYLHSLVRGGIDKVHVALVITQQ